MALSNDLISQFVKATQDKVQTNKESTAYGKIVINDQGTYVQLDGSDLLTPITSTTVVNDGDRVIVTIKNHTAIVTGDLTTPAASDKEVKEVGSRLDQFQQIYAEKAVVAELEAEIARIDKLRVEELAATNLKVETLEGKVADIDKINAEVASIKELKADKADVTTLSADIAEFKDTTTENLEAIDAFINNLDATYVSADELEATNAEITNLKANTLNIDTADARYANIDELNATNAEINTLKTNKLDATEANAKYATIENLNSSNAEIDNLKTNKLDAESAKVIFADIDFSNITQAAIQELFTESGIIEDLIVKEGKITGELVGVTIKGDLVEAGTLKADRLVVLGTDGLYYKLNVNALGETTASSDAKYQNGLDGSVIVAKSITADRVAVTDLVAFGATIGGFNITNNAIYSGAKGGVASTAAGIYQDKEGQFAVGDGTNFVKFYKDQNGKYKLEIAADSLTFGSEKKTIESLSEEVAANSEAVKNNTDDLSEYISKTNASLSNLQGQIDGAIMTHFEEYAPLPSKEDNTSANSPAKEWIEADASINKNDQKNNHLGDLFYNTITGYCYRWQVLNNQYFWELVKDVDVTKALADAAKAQDTADNKRRVFVEQPKPPYDVGDLWSQGNNGDLMRCKTAKTKDQTYAAADWEKASKYTDDAKANEVAGDLVKAEARITQNAEAIELRATKTEVTNQVNTINNNLSNNYYNKTQTDAKIKVESDRITSTVNKLSEVETTVTTASTNAQTAITKANDATTTANNAATAAGEAKNTANAASTAASDASSAASEAKTAATNASSAASAASTAAANAQSTANSANTAAANAQSAANTANTNATNAQTAINNLSIGNRNFILNSDRTLVNTPTQLKQSVYPDPVSAYSPDILSNIKSGDTIDMSIEIKVDGNITIGTTNPWIGLQLTYTYDKNGTSTASYPTCGFSGATSVANLNDPTKFPKGKWVRIHNYHTLTANPISWASQVTWMIRDMTGTVSTRRPHVCRSNKPVDWSPAPEDIDASFTTITTRITDAETKIDQNSEAITLRATKTEVEEVKTTATNAKNAIDNLEVGGRNYIPESDKTYTITMTGSTGYNYVILDVSPDLPKLDPSVRTFTISYDAKGQNGGTRLQGYLRASSSASAMSSSPDMGISTTSWARYSRVATLNDGWTVADIATFYARIQGTADDTVYVKNIKVEVGNKKTDWSPAPEDIKTELTTNYYNKTQTDAQIKVASDAINLKVTSVETTANNAATAASNASTAASNAASKAQTAQNTADQAKTTATTANNTANTAKSTADTAKSTADTAKTTANSAVSTANTASSTATTAKNTADAASKTASEAKTAAQNAQDAADAAQEDIDNLEIGGRNLCIESSYTDGYLGSAGAIVAPASYNKERTTDFINVTPGENITIQFWVTTVNTADIPWHAYQYFDANQVAVGDRYASGYAYTGEKNHIIYNRVVPEGVASIRLSMRTYEDGKMKLEKGNKPTDWTPAPEDIETEVTTVATRVADLEVSSTNITASIKSIEETQKNTTDTLGNINTDIATLSKTVESKMDSESVNIAIKSEIANGVSKVQTATGYRFDDEGLTISKTGADTSTNIDEDGMSIYRTNDNEEVLTADSDGVNAFNLHARTYLIIGETSRFEDYIQNGKKRTGCFWIGGE